MQEVDVDPFSQGVEKTSLKSLKDAKPVLMNTGFNQ